MNSSHVWLYLLCRVLVLGICVWVWVFDLFLGVACLTSGCRRIVTLLAVLLASSATLATLRVITFA